MQPHEQRVVDERNDLGEKITKLGDFFSTDTFAGLPEVDRVLLATQHDQMVCYSTTLQRRIDRFS